MATAARGRNKSSSATSSNKSVKTYGLEKIGLKKLKGVHRNLSVPTLIETAVTLDEGYMADNGALVVLTGKFSGRSPKDKFTVAQNPSEKDIWWGPVNQKISPANWDKIFKRALSYLEGKEVFIFDGFVGQDSRYKLPVRVISEQAWHSLFCKTLFVRPTEKDLKNHKSQFTIIDVGRFLGKGASEGLRQANFTLVNYEKKLVLIGGSEYAGEMKKSAFTLMNYLLPKKGVFPMHCSANMDKKGGTALFFGLSGTGKTTLSADPARRLIGDDEHGWTDKGIFNFEGGCYAKTVDLTREKEPQIWDAIRFGSVLENVVVDPDTRKIDYTDIRYTENTRATYPVDFIDYCVLDGMGGHPKNVFFLTCDAFGVLPPISKLTPEQAMYHFLSGYTAKVAGTEAGVDDPEATFSTCFGAPFLVWHPNRYAELLREKIKKHKSQVWLVNTGWGGGPAGETDRISLKYTRALLTAALEGKLAKVPTKKVPFFGLHVPAKCPGVPAKILIPRNTWKNKKRYDEMARELGALFRKNFKEFEDRVSAEVIAAQPMDK
jgi:phosphoenolpyruvate carboxykinase (ATP)